MSKIGDSISKRFDLLRGDVRKLQSDVELMKSDVSKLKVDVDNLKSTVDNLKSTVDNLKSTVVHLGTSLETMVENMDGLAGEFKKFDEEQTVMSYRQSDHSNRLEKLETKVFGSTSA